MDFQTYLKKDILCACGHVHRCDIDTILIEPDALNKLPALLALEAYHHICILEDENTKEVMGEQVEKLVTDTGYKVSRIVLPKDHLLPDEAGIGSVVTELPVNCDLILAVGSGTINDLGKFVSYKTGIPYMIIATAPSMDGFASNVAAMVTKKAKETYAAQMPKAIIADTKLMMDAPMDLIAAGVGDVLGKYVCLTDWKLSNLLTGEYYCEYVANIVKESVEKVKHAAEVLAEKRDLQSIEELMEGLVLSGIAMSYIGNSRPASGSEHHLGHFWEMNFLQFGEHGAYHGTKVGIGTILCLKMYKWLADEDIELLAQGDYSFDREAWGKDIEHIYKLAATKVIALEDSGKKNSVEKRNVRMKNLITQQEEVMALIHALPEAEDVKRLMENLGAPVYPSQIDVTDENVINACVYAKELRERVGLLQVLHDLGLAKSYGERVIREFCK
ncbi:MAG: sn-glycerol-1-phosphate dehydrogenase [Tyzzerella sp.]|nr:sn-glycerol-1-phosphate dehydrogenase [Tyzzerella sp.]